jgi:hypothetical protein
MMKRTLVVLAALPLLAACGDAADESDDPMAVESELTTGAPADPASTSTPEPAATDAAVTGPAATGATSSASAAGAPSPRATATSGQTATVPATNQGAQYQDSVTQEPEAAP